ncbi:hypothetical protein GHK86_05600 [Acidimicrobiaceae bacterium USS-CC1]|uniref:SHOCT domain-containing protein n=1 Tax=Acidiferrimicrobium australe TaxID=2664430 RepID=A0ABW9QQU5_9ACTN|nr:hypothetical protein [Acidiferrimicrobium australe]
MFVASSYPLLDVFWTTLWIMGFFLWIWLAVLCFTDIFRSRDMGGFHKAAWVIAIFVLPLVGVLVYLLVRGGKMQAHAEEAAAAQDEAARQYIKSVTGGNGNGSTGTADELTKLVRLRDSGALTPEEYDREKARILAGSH